MKRNNNTGRDTEVATAPRVREEEQAHESGPCGNHADSAFDSVWFSAPDVDLDVIT